MATSSPIKWTREHLLIALNLYCKLLFGSFDRNNAVVKEVAAKMGRSPSSLAMKLSNLASFDPVHRARRVKGLAGASKQDQSMWNEFQANTQLLGEESEQLLRPVHERSKQRSGLSCA
jgi:putative restriction endonuclease